jgi:hypothetical protein
MENSLTTGNQNDTELLQTKTGWEKPENQRDINE